MPRDSPWFVLLNCFTGASGLRGGSCVLFCVRKQHQDAATLFGIQLKLFLIETVGNSQTIATFVVSRFAVHEQHIMVRAVSGDVMDGSVPGIENAVPIERHFLPFRKRADDFHRGGFRGLAISQAPAKHFRKALFGGIISAFQRRAIRGFFD